MPSLSRAASRWTLAVCVGCFSLWATAQQQRHGRGYKAPPPTAEVTVVVQKGFNKKAMPNASVIFRATRDGKIVANLETKTDPDGKASLDLLEVGSHITIQVIASGFATSATDFDLTPDGKQVLVALERPRAQISQYQDNADQPSGIQPGIQEHKVPATSVVPTPPQASPTAPLQTTPLVNTPATAEPSVPASGAPQ